jgi:hypothetical protein
LNRRRRCISGGIERRHERFVQSERAEFGSGLLCDRLGDLDRLHRNFNFQLDGNFRLSSNFWLNDNFWRGGDSLRWGRPQQGMELIRRLGFCNVFGRYFAFGRHRRFGTIDQCFFSFQREHFGLGHVFPNKSSWGTP